MIMAGIYIHIPFCTSKCAYCDFYSEADQEKSIPDFIDALSQEIRLRAHVLRNDPVETIYFGGGTPSLLNPDELATILKNIYSSYELTDDPEISIEINPASVNSESLRLYKTLGVNRLSTGVQSFNNDELKYLGRIHTTDDALAIIKDARTAGLDNIGIDLIFGLPVQTKESWEHTLNEAIRLNPEHISCYSLTWNRLTELGKNIIEKHIPEPDENAVSDLYLLTHDRLMKAGYEHYEISNYAKPDRRCRHNESYWTGKSYLGFGPSAHTYNNNERSWNIPDVREYINVLSQPHPRLPMADREVLSEDQKAVEHLALALRRSEGVPLHVLGESATSASDLVPRYGRINEDRFKPNAQGFLVADEIAAELAI